MNGDHTVFSTIIPDIAKLCCVLGRIDAKEVRDSSAKSWYHWRLIKCRLLIYLVPEVIAAPVNRSEGVIYIITMREFFETEQLKSKLRSLNITYLEPMEVTSQAYDACLRFAMLFHVSPEWNKVGDFLLHGKYFVTTEKLIDAVKLEITLLDEKLRISISETNLRASVLAVEDFDIDEAVLHNFIANPMGSIDLSYTHTRWVHVLPSMAKGKVVTISKQIPRNCPFKTYQQIRRHWKNMYGYRLPDTEEGLVYYEICFPGLGLFTYPNVCLRSAHYSIYEPTPGKRITMQFVNDLNKALSRVCGVPFELRRDESTPRPTKHILKQSILTPASWITPRESDILRENLGGKQVLEENQFPKSGRLTFSANYFNTSSQKLPAVFDCPSMSPSHFGTQNSNIFSDLSKITQRSVRFGQESPNFGVPNLEDSTNLLENLKRNIYASESSLRSFDEMPSSSCNNDAAYANEKLCDTFDNNAANLDPQNIVVGVETKSHYFENSQRQNQTEIADLPQKKEDLLTFTTRAGTPKKRSITSYFGQMKESTKRLKTMNSWQTEIFNHMTSKVPSSGLKSLQCPGNLGNARKEE